MIPSTFRVLVTGARGGIGSAVVTQLHQAGATVHAWDLPEHDVTDADAIARDLANLTELGPLDALIHTAGILHPDSALAPASLAASFAVNCAGVANVCAPVARDMVSRGAGSIVVVSSNAAAVPRTHMASYCASKAAATAWVKALGLECAPHGVRCNVVSPGSTDTPMWHSLGSSDTSIAGVPEEFRLGIPLQRIAAPEDIAAACIFLASPMARHITLHDLRVDGGSTLDA